MQLKKFSRGSSRYRSGDGKYLSSSLIITSINAELALNVICVGLMLVSIFPRDFISTSDAATHTKHLNNYVRNEHQSSSLTTTGRNHPVSSIDYFKMTRTNEEQAKLYLTSGAMLADGSKFYPLAQFMSTSRGKVRKIHSNRAKAIKVVVQEYPSTRDQEMIRKVRNILAASGRTTKSPVSKRKTQEMSGTTTDLVEDIEVSDDEVEPAKDKEEEDEEVEKVDDNPDTTEKPKVNYKVFDTRRALKSKSEKRKLVKTSFYPPGDPDRLYSDALLVYVKDFTT